MPVVKLLVGWLRGGSRIFSRGDFQKMFQIFVDLFLGRLKCLSELCQSFKKTLFWSSFVRRRQNFEKTCQKMHFQTLFGKCLPKNRVFLARALPQKWYIFRKILCQPAKNDISKYYKGSAGDRIPEGREAFPPLL